ncbi:MAG: VOC family protein [Desulfobacterales bacterium]|jgi:methylmalonyl-CoA/ethylmalonyl-CoA epimerase|nr:VOC family protein [Desulfobacterales bacterium]
MIKGINHLGIVVKSIDEVVTFLQEVFGAEEISRIEFPELKQVSATVRIGDGCLELMEPTGPDGPVGKFMESKGGGLHHISLLCDDLVATSEKYEAQGLQVIGKMFDGPFKVAFLHPKSSKGILFELAEKSSLDETMK